MTKLSALTSRFVHIAFTWSFLVSILLCIRLETLSSLHQPAPLFARAQHQRFVDSSTIKPSLILILPQSFKVPTNPSLSYHDHDPDKDSPSLSNTDRPKLQQYVAVINNAQDGHENDKIRRNHKRLSLQVRDASTPITGQLFYEHVFDYFATDGPNHLLIPVNLDQVSFPVSYGGRSTAIERSSPNHHSSVEKLQHKPESQSSKKFNPDSGATVASDGFTLSHQTTTAQQLIVSIRPHQLDADFASDGIELVSSAPVLVEPVPSHDGLRSFSIVQTDKPIYKPTERVRIRMMVVNEKLRPISDDELKLQIKNPHGIIVEELRFPRAPNDQQSSNTEYVKQRNEPTYLDHTFEFPTEPMLGAWLVHLVHSDPVASDMTSFEVKEYVLPPYEITFESPDHILPSSRNIAGAVIAKHHYGKPVQGKIQLKFGFRLSSTMKTKFVARSNIKSINPLSGRVEYNISLDKFRETEWFPAINGARLVVEATVTEMTTGHRETGQDTACLFIQMPYKISFDDSIEDFKSGLNQALKVQLVEIFTLNPGPAGQKLVATYQDQNGTYLNDPSSPETASNHKLDSEAVTDSTGRAIFNIGPLNDDITSLTVTMKLLSSNSSSNAKDLYKSHRYTGNELALDHHTLIKHGSQNGWIALMNKTVTHVNVGDQFVSDLLIRDAMVLPHKIFYAIVAKGQIIMLDKINKDGLVSFQITEEMIPSIRLVLFALTHDSIGLLSDSMRIDVSQDLNCSLSLQYESYEMQQVIDNSIRPNDRGKINIMAREGDLVSLIGVDNAVYSLNNRTRLEAMRIIERIKRLDTGCGFGGGKNNLDVFHNAGLMFHKDVSNIGANEADTSHIGSTCLTVANQMRYTEEAAMGYTKPVLALLSRALGAARLKWSPSQQKPHHSRYKRDVDPESIMKRYKNPLQRSCCRLGTLEDIPQKRNCTTRKRIVEKYMQHASDCSSVYYECCRAVFGDPDLKVSGVLPLSMLEPRIESRIYVALQQSAHHRSRPMRNFGDLDKIEASTLVRKDFRETWLFEIVKVDNSSGRTSLDVRLPHSISSWSISAISLNRHQPMCIMPKPYKVKTFQEVFIQLSLPYKVVQGEQIDMVATLYNYSPDNQDVLVYMYGIEDVCSEAEPGERSERKRVLVDKHSSQAIVFSMIPLKIGRYPVKVLAITMSSNSSDIVEQELNVVARGKPVTDEITFSLDPLNQQRRSKRAIQTGNLIDDIDPIRGLQHSQVRLSPSRESDYIVPQTQECIVSAIGDKVGQAIQTTILDVENLIRMPHGCGEQVMIYLGPTLYTARYLNSINKLTGDLRWRAIRYIQSGYKSVLNFRKENGAFSSFAKRDASIWLTAYVTKMLCQTERTPFIADEVFVDKTVINYALNWLVEIQNKDTGTWIEKNPVYHREMLGGVLKENALTAFVTIALNECSHHSQDMVEELENGTIARVSALHHPLHEQTNGVDRLKIAVQKAEESLIVDRYRALREKNPYVLSLVAYSLSYSRPRDAASVLNDLMSLSDKIQAKNQILWRGEHPIETAAYALQALIEIAPILSQQPNANWMPGAEAIAIANYLSSRRSYSGSFESTQDTVVALEALTKFAKLQSTPNGSALIPRTTDSSPNLWCNVTFSNRTRRSIEFDKDNAQILQTFKLQSFDLDPVNGETLDITTSGNGLGTMSVRLKYNVYQDDNEICRFDIDSTIEEWQPPKIVFPNQDNRNPDGNGNGNGNEQNQQPDDSNSEDDLFKTFDKSMLNELNLINQNEPVNTQKRQMSRDQSSSESQPILRVRRFASVTLLDLSTRNKTTQNNSTESWTSKVVSSIKSKLPSWMTPKTTTQSLPAPPTTPRPPSDETQQTSDNSRRNATSRRSVQAAAPLISTPSGIPADAHLNILSGDFEINGQNKTTTTNSSLGSMIDSPSRRLVLLLRVCAHHMSSRRDSEMAVIEIGVLSGFKPNEADLKEILNDIGTPAMKYELSADRSLVVLYLKYIPFSGSYCFQFRLVRDSLVYNLQSGYIRVYEYYSPTHSCSNFYTPSRVNNLIETKCDASGQVCQCASRSLCPATRKLVEIGEIATTNSTSAREHLVDLVCSNKYDLVSFVRLKSIRYMEASQMFRLSLLVKSDLRGNLTRIMSETQRQQKAQLLDNVRRPSKLGMGQLSGESTSTDEDDSSSLNLSIDSSCVRDDQLLLHLAHPKQWKQGGELMVLFARSEKLERRYFKTTPKPSAPRNPTNTGQYSIAIQLDRDTILHDITYQAKAGLREMINNPLIWLDLKSRRDNWSCLNVK